MIKDKKIAVIMGGWNMEKEVSIASGEAAYESLLKLGYNNISKVNYSRNIIDDLKNVNPDLVFNALHGKYGEDGSIQAILDVLQIPYTHSNLLSSALCMDKSLTKIICQAADIKSPKSDILSREDHDELNIAKISKIKKPFVIKPIDEGSSIGVEIILENDDFDIAKYDWQFGDKIMIEQYVAGQEIQVAIMDNKALGALEVRPKKLFYDYECKYSPNMSEYIMPAEISAAKYQEVLDLGLKCHQALKCQAISRIDFILSKDDQNFYLIDANNQPGLTNSSIFPKIANHVGISFDDIIQYLVKTALENNV